MRKVKVLHINSYYNVSVFYKNLYDKQVQNGLDIEVFVPVSNANSITSREMGNYTNVSVNHCEYDRYLFHLKHFKILKDINKNYNMEDFSIIHAHSLFSNGYIAMKLKKRFKIPYIVAIRNTDVNVFFKKMPHLRKLGIKILKEASQIIFISSSYRDYVIEEYVPDELKQELCLKALVIPNGIDDYWLKNSNVKTKVPSNKIKILYIGEINKNKNITTTIKALDVLKDNGYDITFTVVGRVIDEKIFNELLKKAYINYIKPQPKEQLIDIYIENDIFVMPSIKETFGLVYAEAMSQGLPVIYSKHQGFDKQFNEGEVGYSVTSKSEKDIADMILKILSNYSLISKNANLLVKKFDWNPISESYKNLYNDMIDKMK